MYFCTPTFDPYEGLAKTLQAAYPRPQMVASATAKTSAAAVAIASGNSSQPLAAAA